MRYGIPRRSGFTLVELLVAVTIIGILMGLVVVAAFRAITGARESSVIRELDQFTTALTNYANGPGKELPPDFAGVNTDNDPSVDTAVETAAQQAVIVHLRKRWPNYRPGAYCFSVNGSVRDDSTLTLFQKFAADVRLASGNTVEPNNLSPATALVFWLGGLPAAAGTSSQRLRGFCADETNPLNPTGSREGSLYEFDQTRLAADASGALAYLPATSTGSGDVAPPFVYFRARRTLALRYDVSYQFYPWTEPDINNNPSTVNVRPYLDQGRNAFYEPDGCQILCAGLDGLWGVKYVLPLDQGAAAVNGYEFDNLTSFLKGRLEDLSE